MSKKRKKPVPRKRATGETPAGILFLLIIVAVLSIAVGSKFLRRNSRPEVPIAQTLPEVTPPAALPQMERSLAPSNRVTATPDWRTAIAAMPPSDRGTAYSDKGDDFLARQEYVDAANAYQLSVQSDDTSESVYYNLGIALGKLGRIDEATNAYTQALKIAPDYAEVHNNLGNLLLRKRDLEGAATHFKEVTKINPRFAAGYNNLGITLDQQSRYDEAAAQFLKAIELEPKYLDAHFNLAHSYLGQRKFPAAAEELRAVLALDPGFKPARELLDRLSQAPSPQLSGQRTNE